MKLTVVVERGIDRHHVARCPSLKGCWSQGRTRAEALINLREAIRLYLSLPGDFKPTGAQKILSLTL